MASTFIVVRWRLGMPSEAWLPKNDDDARAWAIDRLAGLGKHNSPSKPRSYHVSITYFLEQLLARHLTLQVIFVDDAKRELVKKYGQAMFYDLGFEIACVELFGNPPEISYGRNQDLLQK